MRWLPAIVAAALFGFVIWRNYGVVPKGAFVDIEKMETNEQRELFRAVSGTEHREGDEVKTSFGLYTYGGGRWKKTKEVWE